MPLRRRLLLARRPQGPIKVRCKTRKAFKHRSPRRPALLVNQRRSSHRAGKVEQMSRALALVALMHLSSMPSEHPFMLELASSPLVKLPCSPPRTIPAFGRLAGQWWLHELSGQRQRRQHFGTLQTIDGLLLDLAHRSLARRYIQSHAARPAPPTLSLRSSAASSCRGGLEEQPPLPGAVILVYLRRFRAASWPRGAASAARQGDVFTLGRRVFGVSKGLETGWLAAQFLSSY